MYMYKWELYNYCYYYYYWDVILYNAHSENAYMYSVNQGKQMKAIKIYIYLSKL